MKNVTRGRSIAKLSTFVELAERAIKRDEGAEAAGEFRARLEAQEAAARATRERDERHHVKGDVEHERSARPLPASSPRKRGTSASTQARWRQVEDARLRRLRDDLVRRGAPTSTPVPRPFERHNARRARDVWHDPNECARQLASLPPDIARRMRELARSVSDRAHARRLCGLLLLLVDLGVDSKQHGPAWKTVTGFSRAGLAEHLPHSERRRAGALARLHMNTVSNLTGLLVEAGLVKVTQVGPETARERGLPVGPSGNALAQYRVLWFRPPCHNQNAPAFSPPCSAEGSHPLQIGTGEAGEQMERASGPP